MFRPDERTRVVEGLGSIGQLGTLARELGARRALLVSDPGVEGAGHTDRGHASLVAAGLEVARFVDVHPNPTTADLAAGLVVARDFAPDLFVAVGGGSSIDAAKGINFLHVCGGEMQDYWGHDKATAPLLPLIAVPTTAGTGSEVQSFALISDADTHRKMACGDPSAAPRIALLDAELTLTLPREVAAITGLDTIAHAVESAVAKPRDPATDGRSKEYAAEACRLALAALPRVLEVPRDLAARRDMLRASALAGLAIEHAMLGAAHSMANPLTQHFDVPHGLAVGLMLPHVVRYNGQDHAARATYQTLARACGLEVDAPANGEAEPAIVARLEAVLAATGLATRLSTLGVDRASLPKLAEESTLQWTANFNPRALDAAAFETLLISGY